MQGGFLQSRTLEAVAYSPACGKWTQTRRIFFLDTFNQGCQRVFEPHLRVLKCSTFKRVSKRLKVSGISSNILRNKSALVGGIRGVFTCFQHLRPQKRGFVHENRNSLAFDYLELRQIRWSTYIHTSKYLKWAGIGEWNPGWHVLDRN